MATREDMTLQERIDAARELAHRICDECRPAPGLDQSVGIGLTALATAWGMEVVHPARIESGPQSEAQFEEQMRELYPGWGEAE